MKYDVYRDSRGGENLLLVVQADMFDGLDTRLAIPLLPERPGRRPLAKLNPVVVIGDKRYVLYTQHMLAVPVRSLRNSIANVKDMRDEITAAVDFIQQGF